MTKVPREVICWAVHKLGVEEWLIPAVMTMYNDARTVVRTACGNTEIFEVRVGMHRGSGRNPLLFATVTEVSKHLRVVYPGNCYVWMIWL